MSTLIIQGVDLEMLERQRRALVELASDKKFKDKYQEALDGMVNMLDTWSDNQLETEAYVSWGNMSLSEKLRYQAQNEQMIDGHYLMEGKLMMEAAQTIEDLEAWQSEAMKDPEVFLEKVRKMQDIDNICARLYIARHITLDSERTTKLLGELDQHYRQGPEENR